MSTQPDTNPEKYQPITDRKTANAIRWLHEPETEQDIRTGANIPPDLGHLIPAVEIVFDYIEQLTESPLTINDMDETEYLELSEEEKSKIKSPNIGFKIDKTLKNVKIRSYTNDILLLSYAKHGDRAEKISDMIKNKNRPQFNPMGMLAGLAGDRSDEEAAVITSPEVHD